MMTASGGIRDGARGNRIPYGRVRPGFIHFSERFFKPQVVCPAIFPIPEACLAPKTNFALDVGGTVELSPAESTVLRFDLGDTLTRYGRATPAAAWYHGLQFAAGFGWRF